MGYLGGAAGATQATETVLGVSQIATQTEVNTASNDVKIVTPLKLDVKFRDISTQATEVNRGTTRIATQAEVDDGTLDDVIVTPAKLSASAVITDSYTKIESDARYVEINGDTMTGTLALNADPSSAMDAATKQYVDANSGDMTKGTYDTNNNGIVDNAEMLEGQNGTYYLNYNNLSNKPRLEDLEDSSFAGKSNGDIIGYNGTNWINKNVLDLGNF